MTQNQGKIIYTLRVGTQLPLHCRKNIYLRFIQATLTSKEKMKMASVTQSIIAEHCKPHKERVSYGKYIRTKLSIETASLSDTDGVDLEQKGKRSTRSGCYKLVQRTGRRCG